MQTRDLSASLSHIHSHDGAPGGSVLQCAAVCCSVLQRVAVWCSMMRCVAMSCAQKLNPVTEMIYESSLLSLPNPLCTILHTFTLPTPLPVSHSMSNQCLHPILDPICIDNLYIYAYIYFLFLVGCQIHKYKWKAKFLNNVLALLTSSLSPARTRRACNTFIDDLFAFVITMPGLHRMSVFRDDIGGYIYIYIYILNTWIYIQLKHYDTEVWSHVCLPWWYRWLCMFMYILRFI